MTKFPYTIAYSRSAMILSFFTALMQLGAGIDDIFPRYGRPNVRFGIVCIACALLICLATLVRALQRTTLTEGHIEQRTLLRTRRINYEDVRHVRLGGKLQTITYLFTNDGRQLKIKGMPNQVMRAEEIIRERVPAVR